VAEVIKQKRCAIYTRKSTDEGLDMDFNSLDAQREAAENYIASQKHRGWSCLDADYSDGGFSGGNMERPALRKLLDNISAGEVDVVVVYKIDRLSRSLLDFASLLTLFDKHEVSFVSVTQDINTSSSSGRMMLNILMTFAQYEREIIGERIRDKVAAAKRKGMHCGGPSPLGYASDPQTKKLLVVEKEAPVVRRIFESYLRFGSARDVAEELARDGVKTPIRVSRKGNRRGGQPFTTALVYATLANPVYLGLVRHGKVTYPGEHEAIIDKKLWEAVHEVLKMNTVHDGKQSRRLSPLRGLVRCGCCNGLMIENFTKKSHGKLYRYYICEKDSKRITSSCPVKSVPVAELEGLLLDEIGGLLQSPALIGNVMSVAGDLAVNGRYLKSEEVTKILQNLRNVWDVMFPGEKHKFIRAIIERMTITPDEVRIEYNVQGLEQVMQEAGVFIHEEA
jgi:site-specific DNA recombinase